VGTAPGPLCRPSYTTFPAIVSTANTWGMIGPTAARTACAAGCTLTIRSSCSGVRGSRWKSGAVAQLWRSPLV